jgi:phage-related tail protein
MKFNSGIAASIALIFAVAALAACEKGPAEKAGASLDKAAKKVGDKMEEVGDKMEEVGDKIKDAVKK